MFLSDQWCPRATQRVIMCLGLKIGDLGDYGDPEYFFKALKEKQHQKRKANPN